MLMEEILHQLIGNLSHYLQCFSTIPGGERRISSINSITESQTEIEKRWDLIIQRNYDQLHEGVLINFAKGILTYMLGAT